METKDVKFDEEQHDREATKVNDFIEFDLDDPNINLVDFNHMALVFFTEAVSISSNMIHSQPPIKLENRD